MARGILPTDGRDVGARYVARWAGITPKKPMTVLVLCTVAAVALARADSPGLVPAGDRETLASTLQNVEGRILNIKIESEAWVERRASVSEKWARTPIHVAATAWIDGLGSNRGRIDVHQQRIEWHDGAAPYFETSFTIAFDGSSCKIINHTFGYDGKVFPRRRARILPTASPRLWDTWAGSFTGMHSSVQFLSRAKGYRLSQLLRRAGDTEFVGDNTTVDVRRTRLPDTDNTDLQIDIVGNGRSRQHYRLDPSRGFALLESKKVYTDEDGHETVKFRTEVKKLREIVPGTWYPIEATFERPSSGPTRFEIPYERVVYRALRVTGNDPNFDAGVFTVRIPDGYSVDDEVTGTKYRVGEEARTEEK